MEKKKNNKLLVAVLLILAVFIAFAPLFMLKDAEFGGSDDKGNSLIEETDPDYEPWAANFRARWRVCCSVCRQGSASESSHF